MPNSASSNRAEIADVGRLARRLLDRAVETARTENHPLRRLLLDHLGPDAPHLPTVSATWPAYEHVNVQIGLTPGWRLPPGTVATRCTASPGLGSCATWRSSGSATSCWLPATAPSARRARAA